MSSQLFLQLQESGTAALKGGDKDRLEALRLIISGIKNFEIDTYPPSRSFGQASPPGLTDEDVVKVLQKQAKRHRESIEAFQKANRTDLVSKEQLQLSVVEEYLPTGLTEDEIKTIIEKVLSAGATDFGKVMGMVMKEVAGRADGTIVSKLVKEKLQ